MEQNNIEFELEELPIIENIKSDNKESESKVENITPTNKVSESKLENNNPPNKESESDKDPNKENKQKNINGWTKTNQSHFFFCLHRLKYYRIINNFYIFELKKKEGRLSWGIIVLSSFSSVLSLVNTNIDIFPYSAIIVKWSLVFLTLITTLISSYIKKQQFIERINKIDRYLQQLNQTIEDLNITFILEPRKREEYDEFCKKYVPIIKTLSVYPDAFSPKEWKRIVYTISKHYPELIHGDGTNTELLWPWYNYNVPDGARKLGPFKNYIMDSFDNQKSYKFFGYFNNDNNVLIKNSSSINNTSETNKKNPADKV